MGVKDADVFPLFELPADMQRVILGYLPLVDLARLARLNKELRIACVERVTKRDAAVTALLESHFPPAFREGLTPAHTALPRDLVVHPPVRGSRSLPATPLLLHPSPLLTPFYWPPLCLPTRTRADGKGGCVSMLPRCKDDVVKISIFMKKLGPIIPLPSPSVSIVPLTSKVLTELPNVHDKPHCECGREDST